MPPPDTTAPPLRGAQYIPLAVLAVVLIPLFAFYHALTVPDAWFGSADSKWYGASTLSVASGTGILDGDALVVTPSDDSGAVIVTAPVTLRSREYPGIAWRVSNLPAATEARLLWRSEFKPGRTLMMDIPVEADRLAPVVAARSADWIGSVNGVALALKLPGREPVRVAGVRVETLTLGDQLKSRLREWTAFEAWSGASINTVVGGADLQELPLPMLLGIAALIATAACVAISRWRRHWIGARLPLALALMFAAAWLVLDARWQLNLARQVSATAAQYGGKDWREKHLAAEDGALFEFIERVRARLPSEPARVFMIADAQYFRSRGAYHLYPHNVYADPASNTIPPASALRAGDYLVVFQRHDIQYDAAKQRLRWAAGTPVAAEALLVEPGAALFRIR